MNFDRTDDINDGITLRVGIFQLPPWTKLANYSDGGFYLKGGILKNVLKHLSRATDFKFQLVKPLEAEHGARRVNGSWSGVIGLLHTGKADMALAPFIPMAHRHEAVDFSSSFGFSIATILSGKAHTAEKDIDFLNHFFDWKLLFLLMVTYFLVVYLLVLKQWMTRPEALWNSTWVFSYQFLRDVIECALRGSLQRNDSINCVRGVNIGGLLKCMWFLTVTVTYCYVMASFKASLATIAASSIDSLHDLLKNPNIKPVVLKNSAFQDYFKYGHSIVQENVWKSIVRLGGSVPHKVFRSKKILTEVLQGKSVLISNFINLKPLVSKFCPKKEHFYFSRSSFFSEPITLGLRKNLDSNIRQILDEQLTQFAAMKHLSPLLRRSNFEASKCVVESAVTQAVSLHMTHLISAIHLFIGGLLTSCLVLALEIFANKCRHSISIIAPPISRAQPR